MQRGFTIFEILLSLVVMSMIIVAGIEWSNRKHEESAAAQLGHRLFQYGLAVTEYARQNPKGYSSTNPPPAYFNGIDWLKDPQTPNREMCQDPADLSTCETFLGRDFDFHFDNLKLTPLAEGNPDSIIRVIFETPSSATPGPLRVQLVEVGKVYRLNKKKHEYDIDISLDTRAINFANHFTDQNGSAQIFYQFTPIDITGMITGQPFTQSANVDAGYLRTDGSNEMDSNLRFSPSAGSKKIVNTDEIEFSNQRKFKGIVKTEYKVVSKNFSLSTNMIPVNESTACFLTIAQREWKNQNSNSRMEACEIYINPNYSNNQAYWMLKANMLEDVFTASCQAVCLNWGT